MPNSRSRLATLLLTLLTACSGGGGGTGPSSDEVEDPRSLVVAPGGGSLASLDGRARVEIPAGALPAATAIEVERLRSSEVPSLVAQRAPIARVWRFGPERLQFAADVEVTLRYDSLPAGADVSRLTMITIGLDGQVEVLRNVRVTGAAGVAGRALRTAAGGDVRGLISHFSPFAIVALPRVSGTFGGTRQENAASCSPPLPGYGAGGTFPLELVVTQTGLTLRVVADSDVVLTGTIDVEGRITLHGQEAIDEPEFTGTNTVDVTARLEASDRLVGSYTVVDSIRDSFGTAYVCTAVGSFQTTRTG